MSKTSLIVIICLWCINGFAQDSTYWKRNYPNQHWQKLQNWDAPGNYEIAATLSKTTVYKGDEINLDIYITGYGVIGNSKIYFVFSDTFYSKESYILSSLGTDIKGDYIFGKDSSLINGGNSFFLSLKGLSDSTWPYATLYPDLPYNDYLILSEMNVTHPPSTMHIKLNQNIEPGDYTIKIFFTYYNGDSWKSSNEVLTFHVNSWVEEYATWLWIIGAIISAIGIILAVIFERSKQSKRNIY